MGWFDDEDWEFDIIHIIAALIIGFLIGYLMPWSIKQVIIAGLITTIGTALSILMKREYDRATQE